jgi:hypothetical protein
MPFTHPYEAYSIVAAAPFIISINLAVIDLYITNYRLEESGQPPSRGWVIVKYHEGPPSLRKGLVASARKIRERILHDEGEHFASED